MNYYIADMHFCHKNILAYDSRPWDDIESMEKGMIDLWNKRVTDEDDVYILGDFCWGGTGKWRSILSSLNGRKHLITGNHDLKKYPEDILALLAEKPTPYMEIVDGDYRVDMSHYPMISYNHDVYEHTVMLYGHVHTTLEFKAVCEAVKTMREQCLAVGLDYKGHLYNCWCGFFDWAPATLEEIINNKQTTCEE